MKIYLKKKSVSNKQKIESKQTEFTKRIYIKNVFNDLRFNIRDSQLFKKIEKQKKTLNFIKNVIQKYNFE